MALLDKALPAFEDLFREVYETTRTLRFNNRVRQHILAVSLHGSVLEIGFGILKSLKDGNGTAAWILLRSLLETHVDLLNIVADAGYDEIMHATLLSQQERLIGAAQMRSTSPLFTEMSTNRTVAQHAQWIKSELKRLKAKGKVPLSVKKRFEKAGQMQLYDGPYWIMSNHTHGNLNVLESRHMEPSPSGFGVEYFRLISDVDANLLVDTSAGVLANSVGAVQSLLEGDHPKGLERIKEKLEVLRSYWGNSA